MGKKNKIIIFQLTPRKKVRLHFRGPFVAKATLMGIQIDEYFNALDFDVKRVVIWHEKYHMKSLTGFLKIWWFVKTGFSDKKSRYIEEFNADAYAARKVGREGVLKFLAKAQEFYRDKKVEYHEKTHPPIEERIKRIENLQI